MEERIFDYAEGMAAQVLISQLLLSGCQFSVAPFPNDLRARTRTGWVVSWPAQATTPAASERPPRESCAAKSPEVV